MPKLPDVTAVDFETYAIGPRPHEYPPKPVGVSIYHRGSKRKEYLAWGHPEGNNCTVERATGELANLYATREIVYHNAAFDIEVGNRHLNLPAPKVWHDTMLLAYLDDPRQGSLSLKPLADRELGRPPREQNRLNEWLKVHGFRPGADISKAPVSLVAPYAIGDATRTEQLFKVLYQRVVVDNDMGAAYDRERKLVPVLNKMQARGILIDVKRLEVDIQDWYARAQQLEKYIVSKLGGRRKLGPDFKLSSHAQLAEALLSSNAVDDLPLTAAGNYTTKRDVLKDALKSKALFRALAERSILLKYISTYGLKWLENNVDGRVYPRINQVHGYHDESRGGGGGARTGRLSYTDSWQAIPAPGRRLYDTLPNLRDYVIARPGHVLNGRDYSQQELRILAHYESGPLLEAYHENPRMDVHDTAKAMMEKLLQRPIDRRPVKDTGFGLIYGMGLKKLAKKMEKPVDEAKEIRRAYLEIFPGLKALQRDIEDRCKKGEPIRTWGGRLYWVEPPKVVDGDLRSFEYKMLNVLIQGSAGDCTKEAMIRADAAGLDLGLQIHDELLSESERGKQRADMQTLREAMESVPFDVAMLSDGKTGRKWGSMKKVKEK